jgi:hypothetical protein
MRFVAGLYLLVQGFAHQPPQLPSATRQAEWRLAVASAAECCPTTASDLPEELRAAVDRWTLSDHDS